MRQAVFLAFILMLSFSVVIDNCHAATVSGSVTAKGLKSQKDILVYIEKVEGKEFAPPEEPAKMDQISLVFVPHVLPVVKGTTVEFHNSDDVLHNVFGVGVDEFDLGTWGKGGTEKYTFNNLGDVAILCNVHPEMEAYVVILENPYFALTDEEGNYKIEGIPAGTYDLKTWHDRLKSVKKGIEVSSDEEMMVDFELKR